MEDPFTIRKASSHVKVACRRSCWSCREFGLVELKILKNKEEKEKINKNNIFFYFFNSSCDLWWLINSSEHVLIWSVFGWLKASRLACFSSHRITVHVLSEQYFFLTTISRNSIFQSCRTGPWLTVTEPKFNYYTTMCKLAYIYITRWSNSGMNKINHKKSLP